MEYVETLLASFMELSLHFRCASPDFGLAANLGSDQKHRPAHRFAGFQRPLGFTDPTEGHHPVDVRSQTTSIDEFRNPFECSGLPESLCMVATDLGKPYVHEADVHVFPFGRAVSADGPIGHHCIDESSVRASVAEALGEIAVTHEVEHDIRSRFTPPGVQRFLDFRRAVIDDQFSAKFLH